MNPDVILGTSLVRALSVVESDGAIIEPSLETYARHLSMDEEAAESVIEGAIALMVEEGEVVEKGGKYYMADVLEDHERRVEEMREESRQQWVDEAQSYNINVWGHI